MNEVYIRAEDLNKWIIKHLPSNKDLYSINDLIGAIENLDDEIEELQEQIEHLTYKNDYPEEEYDRERHYEREYGDN